MVVAMTAMMVVRVMAATMVMAAMMVTIVMAVTMVFDTITTDKGTRC